MSGVWVACLLELSFEVNELTFALQIIEAVNSTGQDKEACDVLYRIVLA